MFKLKVYGNNSNGTTIYIATFTSFRLWCIHYTYNVKNSVILIIVSFRKKKNDKTCAL